MHLYEIPLIFVLIGLVLYTVLAGADFGAGLWQLTASLGVSREAAQRIREHAHHSMAPVWEANHVWLIFVITVTWTAYPSVFASIASTLSIPLFVAGIGIVFRGAAYALRAGSASARESRRIDTVFSLSCILTPFALGAAIGGIVSRRVPVGNAAGRLFSSWTGPTSILIGLLAVGFCAYLAAVYLAADAARHGDRELEERFRIRALLAGAIAGALAIAGLFVLHSDVHPFYRGLVAGDGLPALLVSVAAGLATLALVAGRRFALARYGAALAVAGIIAGGALAQHTTVLPGLTIRQAAAGHETLVAVVVAVLAGAVILFPSLGLLFRLVLGGRFDPGREHPDAGLGRLDAGTVREDELPRETPGPGGAERPPCEAPTPGGGPSSAVLARVALAGLVAGVGFLTIAEAGWAHALGLVALLVCAIAGFLAVGPTQIAEETDSRIGVEAGAEGLRGPADGASRSS